MQSFDTTKFTETLVLIVTAAFILERALALVFEQDFFQALNKNNRFGWSKEFIAFGLSWKICDSYHFDAIQALFSDSNLFDATKATTLGYVITAMVIAGGSKGAMKLMQDYLGIKNEVTQSTTTSSSSTPDSSNPVSTNPQIQDIS